MYIDRIIYTNDANHMGVQKYPQKIPERENFWTVVWLKNYDYIY